MHTSLSIEELRAPFAQRVSPGDFEPSRHFYPRVLNAQIHPLVAFFLRLDRERLIERYCHIRPKVQPDVLRGVLAAPPRYFRWGGADLFYTTTTAGDRRMVVIETNSCPSGNKSMPLLSEDDELGGYRRLLNTTFMPMLRRRALPKGELAVIFDKNSTEASGYAAALAELSGEPVYLCPFPADSEDPPARFDDGLLEVRLEGGEWIPIRAAFRYVTQRPWTRIPVCTKTAIHNPVIACLAGGRNKLVAAKAYDFFNAELSGTGLSLRTPETIRDVTRAEIPLWMRKFGGRAVVKNPYSNAGQGVYTITNERELEAFMELEHQYERFIVQALVGNYAWSSDGQGGRNYHVGTMPDKKGEIYVTDLRMMVAGGPEGFVPIAVYARRARKPLLREYDATASSWEMLGTNLSERGADGGWVSATDRLMLMDRRDFNKLGLGPDDLIEAYIQTVLAVTAIDRMADTLMTKKKRLRLKLFKSLDDDPQLLSEILANEP